ncbi:MAG: DUF2795 domain-containing protein [Sphingomonadaceae bacterium]
MSEERVDRTEASPAAVVDYLEGVQYPCSKADILEHVTRQGAPQMVVDALQRLPDRKYYDLAQVIDYFSRVSP